MNLARLAIVQRVFGLFLTTALVAGSTPPASRGIEAGDLDRTVEPCTDFDAFANGAWRRAHPIPAGTDRWNRRFAARAANREELARLLRDLAADGARGAGAAQGSVDRLLGDHFAACMDEAAIDAQGLAPLQPLVAEIASVRDVAGVARSIRRLHELAVPAPFVLTGVFDVHAPTQMVAQIAAGGLGLPGRDHYVKSEPRFVAARDRYRAHVAKLLTLAGVPDATARKAAVDVLGLETRLAEASLDPSAAADPMATANDTSFAELEELSPRVDWPRYFSEAGLDPKEIVHVAEPKFLARLERELAATPIDTWHYYLTFHLLASAAPWLSRPFADESFAFRDQFLGGAGGRQKPRALRCLESTEALLGEPLGRKYAERSFPPAAKAKVREMVANLLGVLTEDVAAASWMTPEAHEQALAKVADYDVMVGYPDVWADTSSLTIRRDAFWADVAAARRFGVDTNRRQIGQPLGRKIWQLPASSPGAYIDVQLNQMVLPAGFLQAPAFDLAATDAVNYGAIGIGVAHDMTHAIDRLGADFDVTGRARVWWSDADRAGFTKLGRCVVAQYEAYEVAPGVHLNGERVLGEAVGDLAGVRIAYRALQRSIAAGHPVPTVDGFTPEQQFFLSWAQYRGAAETPELQRQLAKSDTHATAKYRVNGPLASTPEFAAAFGCKAGSPMVLPEEKRCRVW
jgi:endothelin-converting enzyme/putative endopeptidase